MVENCLHADVLQWCGSQNGPGVGVTLEPEWSRCWGNVGARMVQVIWEREKYFMGDTLPWISCMVGTDLDEPFECSTFFFKSNLTLCFGLSADDCLSAIVGFLQFKPWCLAAGPTSVKEDWPANVELQTLDSWFHFHSEFLHAANPVLDCSFCLQTHSLDLGGNGSDST